jgi:tetratricopeptide (TPR) repeat protein
MRWEAAIAVAAKPLIFISYSHVDETWLDYVRSHLRTAEYTGEIALWDDRRMLGGADWEAEIASALSGCRVCILLVSRHSLTSDYINRVEMRQALERARTGGVHIYPIMLSSVHVAGNHWLRSFNWRPRDGRPLQSLPERTDERDSAMAAIVGEVVALAASATSPGKPTPSAPLIDTSALPDVSLVTLRGRDTELARLDAAWADPKTHVFSVVAWGGQGKTALVATWADKLKAEGGRGADAILAWSFYSQGTKERATSADRFLDWAMKKLGLPDPGPSATLKAEKIAEALQRRRVLLILDGAEPLQHGPGPQEGQLKDPALHVLLRRAADSGTNGGLVLVTTRLAVKDIERWKETGAPVLDLQKLSDEAGAALLADRGVKGSDKERRAASRDFDGHALALTLLSGFLVRRLGGDVRRRDEIGPFAAGGGREMDAVHGHARRVMESIDAEWLASAPLHRAILSAAGLFDRPASADCLEALHKEPIIPGLEAWQTADKAASADAIFELREAGLLAPEDTKSPGALDAHPLVREWFGDKLRQDNEADWNAAHGRLYEHLRDTTREGDNPDLIALEPLFQAIPHGCKAGRHEETLQDIYMDRICRREHGRDRNFINYYYAQNKLGAIGPSLAALAWFFDTPFDVPNTSLAPADRIWVLGNAATYLSGLGRLDESCAAQRSAIDMAIAHEDWRNAADGGSNLALAELAKGEVAAAKHSAAQAAERADGSGDASLMVVTRTIHAGVLAAAGESGMALTLFKEAEERQAKREPDNPRLNSLRGYWYCDLLLGNGAFDDVMERSTCALEISVRANSALSIGLDNASLGRAALGLALIATKQEVSAERACEAGTRLGTAVTELRSSSIPVYLSTGLLARARCFRAAGDFSAARRDLDEVEEIAEPGPMKLHLCVMEIECCRLALAERDGFAPLAETPVVPAEGAKAAELTEAAKTALAKAADLIERCGYHKRDEERDELQAVLEGKRAFKDLPIHV